MNMVPNSMAQCVRSRSKCQRQRPDPGPRKKGPFRVAISDRPPSPPWDPRQPEIDPGAQTNQFASDTV